MRYNLTDIGKTLSVIGTLSAQDLLNRILTVNTKSAVKGLLLTTVHFIFSEYDPALSLRHNQHPFSAGFF